jgi:hypothetical protein
MVRISNALGVNHLVWTLVRFLVTYRRRKNAVTFHVMFHFRKMFGFAGGQNCTSLFDYLVFSVAILWLILGRFFLFPLRLK